MPPMTNAAHPYGDVRRLIHRLTFDAADLARDAKADAKAARTSEERRAARADFDRMARIVRVGAAYLVRLDEAALRLARTRRENDIEARQAQVHRRYEQMHAVTDPLPADERLPHMEALRTLARDLSVPDEAFAARLTEFAATVEAAKANRAAPAETSRRSQAEITAAASPPSAPAPRSRSDEAVSRQHAQHCHPRACPEAPVGDGGRRFSSAPKRRQQNRPPRAGAAACARPKHLGNGAPD